MAVSLGPIGATQGLQRAAAEVRNKHFSCQTDDSNNQQHKLTKLGYIENLTLDTTD